LIEACSYSEVEKLNILATLWKIFLYSLPHNQNYSEWVDKVSEERKSFKEKLKEFNNFKKMSGDPLGGLSKSDVNNKI
jgi:hypothetical protein